MTSNKTKTSNINVALIGNSEIGNSYATTIIKHRPDVNLKYIYPENNNINKTKTDQKNSIKNIISDPSVKIIIVAEQNLQLIKLASEYNKSILLIPQITHPLNYFYQVKCILTNNKTPYYIPLNSKIHAPFQNFKNEIFSQREDIDISFIHIAHKIDNYDNYWATSNLHDLELIQWLTNSEINEIYTKKTPKALSIQLTLKNNSICNLEITISHYGNTNKSNINIQTLHKTHMLNSNIICDNSEKKAHYLDPNTQSMHLNQLIQTQDHNTYIFENFFKLLSIQIAAKQSLKENKPIRINSIIAQINCNQGSILPINYLNN